jgi:glutamate-1-semialdehyde aminotransferase
MAKRLARLLPGYSFDDSSFFACDGAPTHVQAQRRAAFMGLANTLQNRHPLSIQASAQARDNISDMQFISAYRVPFQFSPMVREHLKVGSFLQSAQGVQVTDLDGQVFYDLTGSYGVNVFGADFYKETMQLGMARTQALGPILGSYHPVVASNAERLKAISGLDEVSFHMSGTEAVMQAVRLARYHTRRKNIVRFCGAYHGWWEDVQPGPGNPMPPRETFTLSDMSERSLQVLRTRKDIACVLINPLQALHTNANAPGDSTLVDSSRRANYDREAYTTWLKALRKVCTERCIALIFDEVFLGFMSAFLDQLETPAVQAIYHGLDERWNARAALFNSTMTANGLPFQVANMSSVWTLFYTQPSRYNWMLQYYLRLHGLALSWVGTGRMIFSLNYSDEDFDAVMQKFVQAGLEMQRDGWWWHAPTITNQSIRRSILKETLFR